jgi:hypothetical protein
LAIDATQHRVDGELLACGGQPVMLDLSTATDLRWDSERLERDAFFARLQVHDILAVDGWIDQWRTILVTAASVRERAGHEARSEVRGEIVELAPEQSTFLLHVLEVHRDHAGLPPARPLRLSVRVDDRTRIEWVPRLGHPGPMPFSVLRIGMLVDVTWHGPAPDLAFIAHKVVIRANERHHFTGPRHGDVTEVDLPAGRFVLTGHGRSTFWIGGERYRSLVVIVDEHSFLWRRNAGQRQRIGLEQLQPGARVLLLAERVEGNIVRALLVREEREAGR